MIFLPWRTCSFCGWVPPCPDKLPRKPSRPSPLPVLSWTKQIMWVPILTHRRIAESDIHDERHLTEHDIGTSYRTEKGRFRHRVKLLKLTFYRNPIFLKCPCREHFIYIIYLCLCPCLCPCPSTCPSAYTCPCSFLSIYLFIYLYIFIYTHEQKSTWTWTKLQTWT